MQKKILILVSFFLLTCTQIAFANNLTFSNVKLKTQDTSANTILIQFDISWDNSWRDSANYDAAWIFIKHNAAGTTTWNHVTLKTAGTNPSGFSIGSGTGIEIIVPTDKKGCFIQRNAQGSGTLSTTSVQLVWDYGADGYGSSDSTISNGTTQVKVFGIEMTYIPTGGFFVGDGSSGSGGEFEYGSASSLPPQISSEEGIAFKNSTAADWYYNRANSGQSEFQSGREFNVSGAFPKGYHAFYAMKYETSQKQYVDFLNTLTRDQQRNRVGSDVSGTSIGNYYVMVNAPAETFRNVITAPSTGNGTSAPITFSISSGYGNRALDYLAWMDLAAYADWAALRPMSEFEYEKVSRGPIYPTSGEYAWGTTTVTNTSTASCPAGETGTEYNGSAAGNAVAGIGGPVTWVGCYSPGGQGGPARVGFFATSSTTTRATSGAGYYGNMELAGNVAERVVTIGNTWGLSFSGTHGDGILTDLSSYTYDGNATNIDWPGIDPINDRGVTGASGSGKAGGTYNDAAEKVSGRAAKAYTDTARGNTYGGRLVRTAPG